MPVSSMTLSDFRSEVAFRIGRAGQTTLNSQIDQRVNWAISRIGQLLRVAELEQSIIYGLSTSPTLILPDDCLAVQSMKLVEDMQPLELLSYRDNESTDETQTGIPTNAFRNGQVLTIWPKPSSDWLATGSKTLRVYFIGQPVQLTSDNSLSSLPIYLDEGIVLGAAYMMHRDLNNVERADLALKDFYAFIRTIYNQRGEELQWFGGKSVFYS